MSTEVIVAVIASCTSLLVSFLSLMNSNRSAKGIEKIKFDYDRRREYQKMSNEYFKRNVESLDLFIQAIQRIKDTLFACIYSTENSLGSESVIIFFSQAKDDYFKLYSDRSSCLEEEEREKVHGLKSLAHNIEMLLKAHLDGKNFADELSLAQREDLIRSRENLTDVQNLLRDIKTRSIHKRIGAYD